VSPLARQYALAGPSQLRDPRTTPVRGDLAHIALAGKVFVPHYAVPQPRLVKAGGAMLRSAPKAGAEVLQNLDGGALFDVLDIAGSWVWGQAAPQEDEGGCVGYVELAALGPPQ
jgi:hypothetical protein